MNEQNLENQNTTTPAYGYKNGVRKKKRKNIIFGFLIIVIVLLVFAGIGAAQKMKNLRDKGPLGVLIDKISADLDLSEQQKSDVQKIKDEIRAKMEENKPKRQNDFDEFDKMFRQEKFDKDAFKEIMKKREADREAMKDFMLDELVKFHSILTPDQRNKAADKLKELKDKRPFDHNRFKDWTPPNN